MSHRHYRRRSHPRRPVKFTAVFFSSVTLFMILAACAAEKQRALYSPLDPGTPYYDNYGYTETKVTDGTIEITYLSRDEGTIPYLDYVEQMKEALEQRAHDFALWRAAEATLENGFPHFAVEETTARTRKHIVGRDPDLTPYHNYNYGVFIGYWVYRTNIWLQPVVTLRVSLLPEAKAGAADTYDAKAVIAVYESSYPQAREPVDPPLVPFH